MGMTEFRHPHGVYQKVMRALTDIVRLGTVTLLIVEVPVLIVPLELTVSWLAGNPKLG